jgi:threonine dehydrogenase-like Zn-dependent dehydrogenase
VAVHAVRQANLGISESVAIFGAGAIGLFILQVSRAVGAGEIFLSDIRESRLSVATNLGANRTLNSSKCNTVEEILSQTDGIGVQHAFEAVGLEITLNQALQALQKGGDAVLVGLFEGERVALPANIFVQKEISLVGSQGYHWDFQRAIELLDQGKINLERMITHQFRIEQTQQAFETLLDPDQEAVKVVISSE